MHQLPRLLDPVNMYADVIQRFVLLPHLLLHYGFIADVPIAPALRIIPIIPQRARSRARLLLRRLLRMQRLPAAASVGAAVWAFERPMRLHQLAVTDGGPCW
jgi:hypothetical protein